MDNPAQIRKYNSDILAVPADILSVLRELAHSLMCLCGVRAVVLFGSYSKGTYTADSDVDIAVFTADADETAQRNLHRQALHLTAGYPVDIQILVFPEEALLCPDGIVGEILAFGTDISDL